MIYTKSSVFKACVLANHKPMMHAPSLYKGLRKLLAMYISNKLA